MKERTRIDQEKEGGLPAIGELAPQRNMKGCSCSLYANSIWQWKRPQTNTSVRERTGRLRWLRKTY